jgi:nucleoside-diphosphate-sugar epimerase
MRTLVTGASGLSGSFVARALAHDGFDVVATYRRDTPFLIALRDVPRLQLIQVDLADPAALPGRFDAVVHAAATSPGPGITVAQIVHDNIVATFALIDAALRWKARGFVFFSSMSLYGDIAVDEVDEDTPIRNPDPYGAGKFIAERRLAEVAAQLPGLSLRLPGILGAGARRNWMSSVGAQLVSGATIRAFHLDRPFNNAAHVADIAALVGGVLRRGWQGFDAIVLGARGMTTVRAAVERLAAGLSVPARLEPVAAAKTSFTLSSARAIARYGYDPMEIGALIDRYAQEIRDEIRDATR